MKRGKKMWLVPRTRANNIERGLASNLKAIYNRFREDIIAKLEPMMVGEINEALRPIAIDPLGDRYKNQIYQVIVAGKLNAAEMAAKYISRQFKKPIRPRFFNTRIVDVMKDRALLIVKKNIMPNMENRFKAIITRGIREGATTKQVIGHLKMITGNYNTIAMTEIASAASEASHMQALDALQQTNAVGAFLKGWHTAQDEDVRDSHQQAGEDYGEGNEIPVTEQFQVGTETLNFPAEYGRDPKEVINCRCNEYMTLK